MSRPRAVGRETVIKRRGTWESGRESERGVGEWTKEELERLKRTEEIVHT